MVFNLEKNHVLTHHFFYNCSLKITKYWIFIKSLCEASLVWMKPFSLSRSIKQISMTRLM